MAMQLTLNEEVKASITQALLGLMHEKPLCEISICELVKRAGVARVSFYRNFQSKEDVLVQHMNTLSDRWYQRYMKHPEQDIVCSLFQFLYDIRDTLQLLYGSDQSHLIHRSFLDSCGPRPELSNHDAYRRAILYGLLISWCDEWFRRGMRETPQQLAAFFYDIYTHKITLR